MSEWKPTDAQVISACLSYRHDFGLMARTRRDELMAEARSWLRAWQKELAAVPPPVAQPQEPAKMPALPTPYTAQIMCGENTALYTADQMTAYASAVAAALTASDKPIGYLAAYEMDRLRSGHDARLRSSLYGPSELDCDVPVYAAPPDEPTAGREPAGWRLVPVEPTSAMLEQIKFMDTITDAAMTARYRAMLAAAPAAPLDEPTAGREYRTVPMEPTEAMTVAYLKAQAAAVMATDKAWGVSDPKANFAAGYRAMLAAAPAVAQPQEPVVLTPVGYVHQVALDWLGKAGRTARVETYINKTADGTRSVPIYIAAAPAVAQEARDAAMECRHDWQPHKVGSTTYQYIDRCARCGALRDRA